jgi:hypothetical protein
MLRETGCGLGEALGYVVGLFGVDFDEHPEP